MYISVHVYIHTHYLEFKVHFAPQNLLAIFEVPLILQQALQSVLCVCVYIYVSIGHTYQCDSHVHVHVHCILMWYIFWKILHVYSRTPPMDRQTEDTKEWHIPMLLLPYPLNPPPDPSPAHHGSLPICLLCSTPLPDLFLTYHQYVPLSNGNTYIYTVLILDSASVNPLSWTLPWKCQTSRCIHVGWVVEHLGPRTVCSLWSHTCGSLMFVCVLISSDVTAFWFTTCI